MPQLTLIVWYLFVIMFFLWRILYFFFNCTFIQTLLQDDNKKHFSCDLKQAIKCRSTSCSNFATQNLIKERFRDCTESFDYVFNTDIHFLLFDVHITPTPQSLLTPIPKRNPKMYYINICTNVQISYVILFASHWFFICWCFGFLIWSF